MNSFASKSSPGLFDLLWSSDPTSQLAIGLVLVCFAAAAAFVYAPLAVRLWRVRALASAVELAAGDTDTPSDNQRREVQAAFDDSPLESEWTLFQQRWKSALTDGVEQRSPVRFLDVLDEHPLLPTGARRSLLPALPSLFLAVGLLGTFVGLGLALSGEAFAGSRSGNTFDTALIAAKVGISLRAALWGIALSVLAGFGGRLIDGAFEGIATSLDRSVQRCFPLVSASELTSFGQRAQHESLVGLGQELVRFTTDLTERLDRGLQRIERSTANAASLVSKEQKAGVQNVVRDLALQVRQGVDEHLSDLQNSLERATEHQDTVTGGIAAAFNQMADQSEAHARVTQSLDAAATSVEAASGAFQQTVLDFDPVLTELRETGRALEATSERIDSTHGVVARTAEDVRVSLQHAASAVGEQRDFVEVSLGEIRATLDGLSTGLGENLARSLRAVDDTLSQTVGRLRETIGESNDTIERMSVPMRSAEGTARELHSALERARGEMTGLGDWLAQAMKPVRTSLTQLDERTSDVARAMANFGDHAIGMDKTMDALRGDLREEGRKFRASTSDLSRRLSTTAEALTVLEQAGSSLDPRVSRPQLPWADGTAAPAPAPPAAASAPPVPAPASIEETPTPTPVSHETAAAPRASLPEASVPPVVPVDEPMSEPTAEVRESEPPPTAADASAEAPDASPTTAPPATTLPPFKLDRSPRPGESDVQDQSASSGGWARASAIDANQSTRSSFPRPPNPGESFAGRRLGPDPYSRRGQSQANGGPKDPPPAPANRPLAADLAPDATLSEKVDELSLSGLLGGHNTGEAPLPPSVERDDPGLESASEDERER